MTLRRTKAFAANPRAQPRHDGMVQPQPITLEGNTLATSTRFPRNLLPTPHERRHNVLRGQGKVRGKHGLRLTVLFRIANDYPANRYYRFASVIPDCGVRGHRNLSFALAIPIFHRDECPRCRLIRHHLGQGG